MFNYRYFIAGSIILLFALHELSSAGRVTATLTPAQAVYVLNEPIDLDLTLRNEGMVALTVAHYPSYFDHKGKHGIKLAAKGRVLNTSHNRDQGEWEGGPPDVPHGAGVTWQSAGFEMNDQVSIGPKETWSVKIYLQHFTHDLEPGDYVFTYSVDIPGYPAHGRLIEPFVAAGEFRISIVKGTDAELSAALARHAHPKGDDYWSLRTVMEGLILVNSPVVVPYLTHANALGTNEIILAMKKFRGNREAEAFVVDKLQSKAKLNAGVTEIQTEERVILAALAVLQKWDYVLPEREIWRLLNLPKPFSRARMGAIVYAAGLRGDPFGSQVRMLVNDPDAKVAATAARAYPTKAGEKRVK